MDNIVEWFASTHTIHKERSIYIAANVYGSQVLLQKEYAVPVRHFAKEAAPPALKGDTMLKNIFVELKNKYETAIGLLKKEKITIDPEDPAAVSHYAQVMKTIREKASLSSESQHIQESIETQTADIPDARTYLLTLKEIRIKSGLADDLGAEALMIEALEKIEKDLKKPLLRNDKKGMDLLLAEFDKINKKLGIQKENLPKYEEKLELSIAKAQLEELKKDALEAIETQSKREEFKDEGTVDVYGSQVLLQKEYAVPVRHFAKEAAPPALKGDTMLKNIFVELKNKYETAIGLLKKEKITIDPEDPAAVSHYAQVMKTIREKASLSSESQHIQESIETQTADIPDARTYLLTLKEIRIKSGLADDLGAEALMIEALEKIEKDLKKPLLRNDKKGMDLLLAEFDKINKKLGIQKENLPKYEEKLELSIAKAQLEELKKDALEAIETQSKREEFKDEGTVDVKSLDIRNFI
ncbi:hypothetical protein TanjilG_14104 [Lupinus angustifolius]|uniref:Uncharacterized protein n=1 Tax=Lupinus angustifolius TaxID=3871 RepID=A0A1J7IYF8_LUPAN|nr:hypothetical protein TanjilG_14104 [Lupinus angustifolius]